MEPLLYLSSEAQKYLDNGDYDSAERLLLLALSVQEKIFGSQGLEITETLFNLGLLYSARNDFEKAEKMLLRCLTIERRELAPGDRNLAETVNALTAIHVEKYLSRRLQKQKLALSA